MSCMINMAVSMVVIVITVLVTVNIVAGVVMFVIAPHIVTSGRHGNVIGCEMRYWGAVCTLTEFFVISVLLNVHCRLKIAFRVSGTI